MKQVQVTHADLAGVALQVMSKATVQADDDSLALTQAARNMLRQIASGELVVGTKAPPEAAPPKE